MENTGGVPVVPSRCSRFSCSSLRVRLLLLFAIAIIPALGLILYTAHDHRRQAVKEVKENTLRLARIVGKDQARVIEGARQLLTSLAQLPHVRQHNAAACGAFFTELLKHYSLYANLGAIKPDGEVFCSAVPFTGRVNASDRSYFRRALESRDFAMGDFQIGRITGKATVNFAYPVLDDGGAPLGVVFAALSLSWLNQLSAEASLPEGATLTVVNRRGIIMVRHPNPADWIGRPALGSPLFQAMVARSEGVTETVDVDGVLRVFGFTSLGARPPGAYIAIGIHKDATLATVNRGLVTNLAGLTLVAALAFVAAWVGTDLVVLRRVKALLDATKRLAAGDLAARTGIRHSRGELGALARAFDEMAEALGERDEAVRQLAAAVEASEDAIFGLTLDGVITSWNWGAERIYGYAAHEVKGRPGIILVPPERLEEVRDIFNKIRRGEALHHFETVRIRKDGRRVEVSLTVSPIKDATGRVTGASAVVRDITDLRRAETKLLEQREELMQTEKLAAMGSILAGVAHELNNPLAAVKGQIFLLKKTVKEKRALARVDEIEEATERCARIVRDFLDLARPHPYERQPVWLNKVVTEAVNLLLYQLRLDNIEVTLDLADDLPALSADPHQLHDLAVHLVNNAHQAMRGSPTPRRLTLATRHDLARERVSLEVADTGPGVPPELRARIFEPFFTTKPPGEGTGLGLALCQGIVEAHGGTIEMESLPGQGAVFRIELPTGTKRPDHHTRKTPPPLEERAPHAGDTAPLREPAERFSR